MSTLNDDLAEIQDARDDMKLALEEKGQIVTKDIRTYAQAIANISGGGEIILDVGGRNVDVDDTNLIFEPQPEYTELSYLSMDGGQFINPNIRSANNLNVEISYNCEAVPNGMGKIIGSERDMNMEIATAYNANNSVRWGYNGSGNNYNITSSITHVYSAYTNGKLDIDGVNKKSASTDVTIINLYLFVDTPTANVKNRARGKFYYCKIWENDILIRDFIPVKDTNDVVCLYDKVTKTYFYNQGSGSFIAGPVVS